MSLLLSDTAQAEQLEVDWFHGYLQLEPSRSLWSYVVNMLNSSHKNVNISEERCTNNSHMIVHSHLEVSSLRAVNMGQYWCRIRINSTEVMNGSNSMFLHHPSIYVGIDACNTTEAQSKQERKCVMWKEEDPLLHQSTTTANTIPTSPSTSNYTDNIPTHISFPSLNNTSPSVSDGDVPPTNQSNKASLEGDDRPFMGFYIAAGFLVTFGVIITVLAPILACVCIKHRKLTTKGNN